MQDGPAFGANLANRILDRELKQARAILAVIGVLALVTELITRSKLHRQVALLRDRGIPYDVAGAHHLELVIEIGIAVAIAYLACAVLVSRKPVLATTAGLVLFVGTIVAQGVVDASSLFDPMALGVRLAILIGLVSAVHFARLYERNRRTTVELPNARIAD